MYFMGDFVELRLAQRMVQKYFFALDVVDNSDTESQLKKKRDY